MAREGEKVRGRWHFPGSGRTYTWHGGEWVSIYYRGAEVDGFTYTAPGYDGTDGTRYPSKDQVRGVVHEHEREGYPREEWRQLVEDAARYAG